MEKIQTETQAGDAAKVTALVTKLNRYRHEYYNMAAPGVSDAVYDHLFDELQEPAFAETVAFCGKKGNGYFRHFRSGHREVY